MTHAELPHDSFAQRHLGPREGEIREMLGTLGADSLEALMDRAVPPAIRWRGALKIPSARSEVEVIEELRQLAAQNHVARSYLGMGYHATHTPAVIQRNIFATAG